MRAIEITAFGGPEVLQVADMPMPVPGKAEVLIKVHAAGVNRPDVLQRKGHYAPPPGVTLIPGLEVAGEIVGGDLAESGYQIGDRVCALLAGGGYAEYCVAPIAHCLPVPQGLDMIQAASLPETCFTVWSNLFDRGRLKAGESLLVQGGTSGIGVTAIQIATAMGVKVFATAGSADKCRFAQELGAVACINYRDEDCFEQLRAANDGSGMDVILDMVAGSYVSKEVGLLADDGRLVIIAVMGGVKAEVDMAQILRRRLTITGSTLRARPHDFKAALANSVREYVWPLLAQGKVRPVIHRVFGLDEAAEAHRLMESSQHIGKIMLKLN